MKYIMVQKFIYHGIYMMVLQGNQEKHGTLPKLMVEPGVF